MVKMLNYIVRVWVVVVVLLAAAAVNAQTFYPNNSPIRQNTPAPVALPSTYSPNHVPTPAFYPNNNSSPNADLSGLMPHVVTLMDKYGIWQCIAIVSFCFFLRYMWAERQVKQDSTTFMQNHLNDITNKTNKDLAHVREVYQQLYTGLQEDVQISQRLGDVMDIQFKLLTDAVLEINQKLDVLLERP
jgi:hypothetical protein